MPNDPRPLPSDGIYRAILIILVVIIAPEGIVGSLRKLADHMGWTRNSEAAS